MAVLAFLRWRQRVALLALAAFATGYLSAAMSRRTAEWAIGARMAEALGTRHVFVLSEDPSAPINYPGSAVALRRAGFTVRECQNDGGPFDCFPWAGMSSTIVGPFLLDVRWGADNGGLSGGGSRTRYVALFGAVFVLRELGGWAS